MVSGWASLRSAFRDTDSGRVGMVFTQVLPEVLLEVSSLSLAKSFPFNGQAPRTVG